jgi:antitoxin HicB
LGLQPLTLQGLKPLFNAAFVGAEAPTSEIIARHQQIPNLDTTEIKTRKNRKRNQHPDSTFDSFLEEEGIREEAEAVAIKRVLAGQLARAMRKRQDTRRAMAKQLRTNRSQLDRLPDARNVSVTLDTITRAGRALGKSVIIRVADVKTERA